MNITRKEFDSVINATGSPALNCKRLGQKLDSLAQWFFVRKEEESVATQLVREALLELDDKGYVEFLS